MTCFAADRAKQERPEAPTPSRRPKMAAGALSGIMTDTATQPPLCSSPEGTLSRRPHRQRPTRHSMFRLLPSATISNEHFVPLLRCRAGSSD